MVWEKRFNTLACQPYVFGKQLKSVEKLYGQVEAIISDSPILLSAFYGRKYTDYPESFYQFVLDMVKREKSLNFLIKRVKPYDTRGRNQNEEESDQIAKELKVLLAECKVAYTTVKGNENAAEFIANAVIRKIRG